eukprot:7731307-Lingulodinium_polyedra.AAC.1
MQYFLLAAGHAAGLSVATHSCEKVAVAGLACDARQALSRFPVTFERRGYETILSGLPPHVMDAIGRS